MEKKTKKEIKEIYRHDNQIIAELKYLANCITIGSHPGSRVSKMAKMLELINQLRGTAA